MVYSNNFAVAVKVRGKVVRENGGVARIPFGSEYSIVLKNLNSSRTAVKVSVDGRDVSPGKELILNANESFDLERFVESADCGNRFRFIERTQQIEDHRGVGVDDGVIRVEYWLESLEEKCSGLRGGWNNGWNGGTSVGPYEYKPTITCGSSVLRSATNINNANVTFTSSNSDCCFAAAMPHDGVACSNDNGITVDGSRSDQQFQQVYGFEKGWKSWVVCLKLEGFHGDNPEFVREKKKCPTCGMLAKSFHTYCSRCGTALKKYR